MSSALSVSPIVWGVCGADDDCTDTGGLGYDVVSKNASGRGEVVNSMLLAQLPVELACIGCGVRVESSERK